MSSSLSIDVTYVRLFLSENNLSIFNRTKKNIGPKEAMKHTSPVLLFALGIEWRNERVFTTLTSPLRMPYPIV